MGELVAAVVLLVLVAGCVAGLAWAVDGHRRHRAIESARTAQWEVGESGSTGGVTAVFVRKVTADGDEVGRIPVDQVPDADPQWDERIGEARALAANRAAMLNARP